MLTMKPTHNTPGTAKPVSNQKSEGGGRVSQRILPNYLVVGTKLFGKHLKSGANLVFFFVLENLEKLRGSRKYSRLQKSMNIHSLKVWIINPCNRDITMPGKSLTLGFATIQRTSRKNPRYTNTGIQLSLQDFTTDFVLHSKPPTNSNMG